ncbi:helix-turn-helix domain-containing protein [Rufibacter immobilis]|uniref:helix-turn-helix domain-containing protein n=1 Tax=Rufibacter immobilis TaxID=1348778 RepID=UPI0035E501B0
MDAKEFSFKAVLAEEERQQLVDEIVAAIMLQLKTPAQPAAIQVDQEAPICKNDVCRLLRCSVPTINKWMASGKIPFKRKGRRVYFFKSEVLKSLEQPLTK